MKEIWKDIKGYEGIYLVSNTGKVMSIKFGRKLILKLTIGKTGYSQLNLCKDGKVCIKLVHRLVAQAFYGLNIDDSKICVCHKSETLINGALDNTVNNLFLGTYSDNMQDMIKKGRYNSPKFWKNKKGKLNYSSKSVNQYTLDGRFVKTWDSISDIHRQLGLYISNISKVCNNMRKHTGGYIFKYK